jgi:hypothetical protein
MVTANAYALVSIGSGNGDGCVGGRPAKKEKNFVG